jgi:hypothetical protein
MVQACAYARWRSGPGRRQRSLDATREGADGMALSPTSSWMAALTFSEMSNLGIVLDDYISNPAQYAFILRSCLRNEDILAVIDFIHGVRGVR